MDKKKYPSDRHINSKVFTIRLNNDTYDEFQEVANKQGKSRGGIIVELIEKYLLENRD